MLPMKIMEIEHRIGLVISLLKKGWRGEVEGWVLVGLRLIKPCAQKFYFDCFYYNA